MDKQYRMADVFDLPTNQDSDGDIVVDTRGYISGNIKFEEMGAVVHAINTHDAMQDRIAELEQERDHWKAQDAELAELLAIYHDVIADCDPDNDVMLSSISELLRKCRISSEGCLAEVKVQTIENLITEFNANYYGEELSQWLEQQAEKISQQVKIDTAD